MCGIIGIIKTKKEVLAPTLIGALSRLEYRGYDSAGIAISDNGRLEVLKCVGAPSEHLHAREIEKEGQGRVVRIGIGHNRWATHGKPTINNAHPHTDSKKRVAVVHNGTILNYEILRKELESKGVTFVSETDTEVIPQLIAYYLDTGEEMENAFLKTLERLEGAFGIVAFDSEDDSRLYVAKEGSPIVVGVTDTGYYVASSIHGFLPFTDRFITLSDGEMAVLKVGDSLELSIRTVKGNEVVNNKKQQIAEKGNLEDLSKGDFETFMLKEIFEQPATTLATLLGRVDEEDGVAVLGGLFDHQKQLEKVTHILMTACGTASHAAEVGAYLIEMMSDVSTRVEIASEGRYKKLHFPKDATAVFAVSQSGETADTLEHVKELKRKQYDVFGIINVVGSAVAAEAGKGVYTKAGTEIGVASTKAFTSQMAVMYLLALYIGRMKDLEASEGVRFAKALTTIPNLMKQTLESSRDVEAVAKKYSAYTKIQFLGKGIHVPIAKEAALKFKEMTYLETGAYPLGELKHGPIAIIDESVLSVVLLPRDSLFEVGLNSVEQIKSKGGKVLLVTDESVRGHSVCLRADDVIFVPHLSHEIFYPFLEIIPIQLFAYHFANALGRNIDKPRNLAKSVTVQ